MADNVQDSPEQFTGEQINAFEGGPDEASGGKPIILFKTSKGRLVRSEHVAPYIQSGQIQSPYKSSQVKGISTKPRTWQEQQEMNETMKGQQGEANLNTVDQTASAFGYKPEQYDQELQKANLFNTPQGQVASKRYREKVTGIMAPVKDAEQRMGFLFGPATDAAFARAKEGEAQAAQIPADQGTPTEIKFREPTGLENRTMELGRQVVSGAPMEDVNKELGDAQKQEQIFGGKKELADIALKGKEKLQQEKPAKIPAAPKRGEIAPPLQLTEDDMTYAKGLASGEMSPDFVIKSYSKFGQKGQQRIPAVVAMAKKINPALNVSQRELEFKWGSNAGATKTIAAANNALSNIDKIVKVSDQWARTGSPGLNSMIKYGQQQLGYKNATNISELQIAIGDEVAGVLGYGTSSDLKTKLGIDLTNPNVSPENFRSNMGILKDLLATRGRTMAAPMGIYGQRPGIQFTPQQSGATQAPVKISNEQEYSRLAQGTKYIDPNGNPRTKQ